MVAITLKTELSATEKAGSGAIRWSHHCSLLLLLCVVLLPVAACAQPSRVNQPKSPEELARKQRWDSCYKQMREETGAQACFDYCKQKTGMNEYNIGAAVIKDAWIECQYKQGCNYFSSLAQHKCSLQLNGSGFPSEERMEKLRKRDGIEPGRETWSQSH